jgi:quercetin dioxygenase-like cupin family protein
MTAGTGEQPLRPFRGVDDYEVWQQREGVPIVTGFYIEDLKELELGPWERKGGRGAFVNLDGTGYVNDAHVVEISPGGKSEPERHLYEEMVYVLAGRGATTLWYDERQKHSLEWAAGSLFAIPLNANYQHFNGSGSEPARYVSVTNAPTILRLFHNEDFVFNNPYWFRDRFAGNQDYFSGEGETFQRRNTRVLQVNFVPDVHSIELHRWQQRGGGASVISLELADNSMGAHISQFAPGMYKKAHRHGPGAHVIILDGSGYSLLWKDDFADHVKCDWKPGTVVVPPEDWFHQHFNTGPGPARYLALRYAGHRHRQAYHISRGEGGDVSVKDGGWQIEYEDEDPSVHRLFEAEVASHGGACRMKALLPNCTGTGG